MVTTSLRERMLIALRIRNMSPRTEHIYIDLVARFALHFHRSPDRLGRLRLSSTCSSSAT
jgi:hypothetical protein